MAQNDTTARMVEEATASGERNKALIPSLRNWCQHLRLADCSGGLVAQIAQLPTEVELSCSHAPHTVRSTNLERSARAFILDCCVGCPSHQELFPKNFGRTVLAQQARDQQQQRQEGQQQTARQQELQAEINALLAQEQSQADTKTLSILHLVQELGTGPRDATAATVREAAGLSPQFFSPAALNYLSLFLEDPAGATLLDALRRAVVGGQALPVFARQQVLRILQQGPHLDAAASVLNVALAPAELPAYAADFSTLLSRLAYGQRAGRGEAAPGYPHVLELVQRLARADPGAAQRLLAAQVKLPSQPDRLRVQALLLELLAVAPTLVLPLTELVVQSLDFVEDGYGDSADQATLRTLAACYRQAPDPTLAAIQRVRPTLSEAGQVALLGFSGRALAEEELLLPAHATLLAGQLVSDLAKAALAVPLQQALVKAIDRAAHRAPAHFAPHFEALLGLLIAASDQYHAFKQHQAALQPATPPLLLTSVAGNLLASNPLAGLPVLQIEQLRLRRQRHLRETEHIVRQVLRADTTTLHLTVLQVLRGLASETQGFTKSRLLGLLRDALPDPVRTAAVVPAIYTYLFETADTTGNLRREAVRYVEYLLTEQPACVTTTLLEAVKTLLNDPEAAIRGQAIRAYGTLPENFAEEVAPADLPGLVTALTDPRKVLHQAAVAVLPGLLPYLTGAQRLAGLVAMQALEKAYYETQELEYGKELVTAILTLTRDTRELYLRLVPYYFTKYGTCGEEYLEQEFVRRLTHLLPAYPELRGYWLAQALRYLERTPPEYASFGDLRTELLEQLHQLPYTELLSQLALLTSFVRTQLEAGSYTDAFTVYAVLGAQGLHAELYDLTQHFARTVPATKSIEYATRTNQAFAQFSCLEHLVATAQLDATRLASL
ncbi:hypothetical protein FNT36_23870 [Hymenobacter setariae]|uniref:HEAT repeat domain-containing protein n=1 Tax=Hymenobacter setariae TaxID=2594794 RepID=A0A558BK63_9BACT|nr:hypothetical protein [Hymenobacter setariae]TVT36911.1 hypothetical protein FNT36_23870 [Hymenobacter setariae]